MLEKLKKTGVTIMTKAPAKEITKKGVVIDENGKSKVVSADMVVLAVGMKPDRELLEALTTGKMEVYAIGDSVAPRKIMQAISQGFQVGIHI